MVSKSAASSRDILTCAFGFEPTESSTHFLVLIPDGSTLPVEISEHLSWDPEHLESSVHYGTNRWRQSLVVVQLEVLRLR